MSLDPDYMATPRQAANKEYWSVFSLIEQPSSMVSRPFINGTTLTLVLIVLVIGTLLGANFP